MIILLSACWIPVRLMEGDIISGAASSSAVAVTAWSVALMTLKHASVWVVWLTVFRTSSSGDGSALVVGVRPVDVLDALKHALVSSALTAATQQAARFVFCVMF